MQAGQHLTNCIPNGVCLDLTQNEIALIKKKKKRNQINYYTILYIFLKAFFFV